MLTSLMTSSWGVMKEESLTEVILVTDINRLYNTDISNTAGQHSVDQGQRLHYIHK